MALISCPNCGRLRVSDKAEHCPGCNYNIASYFASKKPSKSKIVGCFFHPLLIAVLILLGVFVALFKLIYIEYAQYSKDAIEIVMVWGTFLATLFLGVIWWSCVKDRLDLLKANPAYSVSQINQIVWEKYKKEGERLNELSRQRKEKELENERIMAELSQQESTPWRMRYFTDPCPYCGHYKVRYSNWDDKKLSVAFWGIWSSKVGKAFHCDYCNRDFNN